MPIPAGSMPKHAQRTRKPTRADAAPVLCSRRCLGIRSAMVPAGANEISGNIIEGAPVAGLPGRAADSSLAPRPGFEPDDAARSVLRHVSRSPRIGVSPRPRSHLPGGCQDGRLVRGAAPSHALETGAVRCPELVQNPDFRTTIRVGTREI